MMCFAERLALLAFALLSVSANAEEIRFVWEAENYGKPGYIYNDRRVELKVVPGKGTCVLASKGKPIARIILAADPTRSAQIAARELQHYIEKITGAKIPITSDSAHPFGGHKILVGESKLTRALGLKNEDFEEQEYLIRCYGNILVLMGHDEQEFGIIDYEGTGLWPEFNIYHEWKKKPEPCKKIGSVYAVDEYLQRFCGVRWFIPGELGEVYPKKEKETIAVANADLRLRPWSDYRWYGPQNFRDYFNFIGSGKPDISYPQKYGQRGWRAINLFMMRMKVVGTEAYSANHSLIGEWFKARFKDRPEVWNQIKAKGYGDEVKQLCLTSDKFLDLVVQDAKDYVAGKSNHERARGQYFMVMAHDYSGQWCRGETCRETLKKNSEQSLSFWRDGASDYMWGLVDRVARRLKTELPGMWTSCCAYAEYTMPPSFELSDNVACTFCRVLIDNFKNPEYKTFYRKWLGEWAKRVKRLYVWEYFDHIQMNGRQVFFPGIFLNEIEDDMRFLRSIGVKGVFNELNSMRSCIPNIAEDHLNLYVFLKLLSQDRNEDIKAADLFEDYCRNFYGSAAEPMKKFFTLAEVRFANPKHWKLTADQIMADWETVCPPAILKQFETHIQAASELATEEPYQTRVRLMREAVYGMMEKNCLKHDGFLKNRKRMGLTKLGKDEAPFQQGRHRVEQFVRIDGEPTPIKTEAWFDYDDTNLYVRVKCHEQQRETINRKVKPSEIPGEVSNIFGDDSVEIFVDVGKSRSGRYIQLAGNINGALWQAKWNRPEPPDKNFKSGARVTVREAKDHWMIDFNIPFGSLKPGAKIEKGEEWGLNLCRNRHRKGQSSTKAFSCWSPTYSSFHETKRFGIVKFE